MRKKISYIYLLFHIIITFIIIIITLIDSKYFYYFLFFFLQNLLSLEILGVYNEYEKQIKNKAQQVIEIYSIVEEVEIASLLL